MLEAEAAARVLETLKGDATRACDHDETMPRQNGQQGLARELARMNLPANVCVQWHWNTALHNLFPSLHLPADADAQYEFRV